MNPDRKQVDEMIRAALQSAVETEAKHEAFNLSGRGHESRVTLDGRLARILRGQDLPRIHISGFGANYFYPLRIFKLAANDLKCRLGWEPITLSEGQVYRNDPPTGSIESSR